MAPLAAHVGIPRIGRAFVARRWEPPASAGGKRSKISLGFGTGLFLLGHYLCNSQILKQKETMHMKKIFVLTASLMMVLTLLACEERAQGTAPAAADDQSASATAVKIDNFSFTPQTLTVNVGTTVTWTNGDDVPHNVVSTDKVFKSKTMATDEKFSYTFAKPGPYNYYCSIHPRMTT